MRESPQTADLIDAARAVFRDELLPLLPPDRRYQALMVANAMVIACRDARQGGELEAWAHELLVPLVGDGALEEQERRLAAEIRAGRRDGETPVAEALMELTRRRVAISNPKALVE